MPKYFNYVFIVLIAAVLVVSFSFTYRGGEPITIDQSEFRNENIMINFYNDSEEDSIVMQMASVNPGYKVEVSYDDTTSSTFAPGYSSFVLEDMELEMKTYRQWLRIIWLPYQTIEINLEKETLKELPENANMKFKSEFAEKLMEYYTKNQ